MDAPRGRGPDDEGNSFHAIQGSGHGTKLEKRTPIRSFAESLEFIISDRWKKGIRVFPFMFPPSSAGDETVGEGFRFGRQGNLEESPLVQADQRLGGIVPQIDDPNRIGSRVQGPGNQTFFSAKEVNAKARMRVPRLAQQAFFHFPFAYDHCLPDLIIPPGEEWKSKEKQPIGISSLLKNLILSS
tara:strand:- start:69 stop:623 length:555 start_codon:yes stop_codon:yes gene_type:complete